LAHGLLAALVLAPLLLLAWFVRRLLLARDNRQAILGRMLERVDGELVSGRSLRWHEVRGRHDGRPFRLLLGTRKGFTLLRQRSEGAWFPDVYPIELSVELQHAPPIGLRIRRDEGLAALAKALGRVVDVEVSGGDSFDAAFLVEADGAPATSPLAAPEVRDSVRALLARWNLSEVAIRGGRLVVRGAPSRMGVRELNTLLDALEILACEYDRRPALEVAVGERYWWTGGFDAAARCPYCHDSIALEEAIVSCGACQTLIHTECHAENQGCPLLGCGGRHSLAAQPGKEPKKLPGVELDLA